MRRRTAGFTLVEMIVTVLIIAILTTFGFQAYQSVVTSTRMSGVINSLLGTLALARSEAMKRGQPVSVCPVASPSATITTCSPTTTVWSTGWAVLVPLDASKPLLQIQTGLAKDTLTSSVGTYPIFSQTGYTFFSGTLMLHTNPDNSNLRRCIVFLAGAWTTVKGATCP